MIEKPCHFWTEPADYRCILTSGTVTSDGSAILSSGLALQAATRYQGLVSDLGRLLASRGNHVHQLRPDLFSFPIRQYDWAKPSLEIIARSAGELQAAIGQGKCLLPRPGCGPQELSWEEVSQVLASLPDNVILVP